MDRNQWFKLPVLDAPDRARLADRFWQHDLRHRRATTWLAAEKSPVKVQKALGDADLETTMRYYQFVRGHLASLVDMGDGNSAELRHLLRQLIDAIENGDGDAVSGLVS